jgi:hypothetical protein
MGSKYSYGVKNMVAVYRHYETNTPLLISEFYSHIYLFYLFKNVSSTLVKRALNYSVIRNNELGEKTWREADLL